MIRKIILTILITSLCLNISAALTSTHWKVITKDIARDGDPKDKDEFEAAKQAFLHIKDEAEAQSAAIDIEKKWKTHFGNEATVGSKSQQGTLMSLIRYPLMTREQAKETVNQLLKDETIAQFMDEQNLKVAIS